MHIFLSRDEKDRLSKWKYSVVDNSITTKLFTPWWKFIVQYVPITVAPNILSLAGLLCILYFFNLAFRYSHLYANLISIVGAVLVFAYTTLDAIDGMHARRTGNSSPLGELFDHTCDNVSVPFAVLGMTLCLGISDMTLNWYIVQIIQLIFLLSHIEAFQKKVVTFGKYTGPGEFLNMYILILLFNGFIGFDFVNVIINYIANMFNTTPTIMFTYVFSTVYYLTLGSFLLYVWHMDNKNYNSKMGLLISIVIRAIPAVLIYFKMMSGDMNIYTVVSHGIIMSILTGDMIVSKMSDRQLHPLIPIFVMLSVLDNFLCIACAFCYYFAILSEISFHMRIPIFGVRRVVFINGVFDLFHRAHMRLCQEAAKEGTYLIVGVLSEEDVLKYKNKKINRPAMTFEQRCDAVRNCGFVDQVIQSPLYIKGEEGDQFMRDNKIDVIMISSEYDSPQDLYYESARRQGKIKVLPRMDGISTTELKQQVIERCT